MSQQGEVELANKSKFSVLPQNDESNNTNSDAVAVPFSAFNVRANRKIFNDLAAQHKQDMEKIKLLENLLKSNNIDIPEYISAADDEAEAEQLLSRKRVASLVDGSAASMHQWMEKVKDVVKIYQVTVTYRDLNYWTMTPEAKIPTVGSTIREILMGTGPKHRVDILKGMTGMIRPGKMTLVMGPPGAGKTVFLKALSGILSSGSAKLEGSIKYNGVGPEEQQFLVPKLVDYVDENDVHSAIMTVRETFMFAGAASTAGEPIDATGMSEADMEQFMADMKAGKFVKDILTMLGLQNCADTVVGDNMLKGISGGQKRRVTLGEMMMCRHSVKCQDSISTGLDAATTFDINNSMKIASAALGITIVTSLLQPSPEVFNLFDDLILLSQGRLIYHGPRDQVLTYFEGLGYVCPDAMDIADYLQELPTSEGRRFIDAKYVVAGEEMSSPSKRFSGVPIGTAAMAEAWAKSDLNQALLKEMDEADAKFKTEAAVVPTRFNKKWAGSLQFYYWLLLDRQMKLVYRDAGFLKARIMQSIVIGGIAGSLFANIETEDFQTMNGLLFFGGLNGALAGMSLLPTVFAQRDVFYKQSKALFFPTSAFVFAQTIVLIPVLLLESIIFSNIIYWSAGLSSAGNGGRYFTFLAIVIALSLSIGQFFRMLGSMMPSLQLAQPMCGVAVVIMVLFSGYIIPKSNIPPGWEWFYYINPISWTIQSVTINEFTAPDYDFLVCTDQFCSTQERFGDVVLEARGLETDGDLIWVGFAVLMAEYALFLVGTALCMTYIRAEPTPTPPIITPESEDIDAADESSAADAQTVEIKFEPVSFAFKDVWYSVMVGDDELDLLKGVDGYFEPGTVTALMGSSGAGKTTLLDVLAGRKNTGRIEGGMFVNGQRKDDGSFRHIMGYVEQFDSLSPHDTAREALEFSAALRLPQNSPDNTRKQWIDSVLAMLELTSLENTLVGDGSSRGMSFEQKKRVSIGVELVANPSILFLDEPTSGLDSRSAQVVIRCIKRVAASGRAIVCTIHQPSVYIFEAFDSLLLLRRGGQTVFFGPLGENSQFLREHFEGSSPEVPRLGKNQNPATWMLEVIGAGTGSSLANLPDFHNYYKASGLCTTNTIHIQSLCSAHDEADLDAAGTDPTACMVKPVCVAVGLSDDQPRHKAAYSASYPKQFALLMRRAVLSYWRSPSYNFVRMVISVVIALIFASTYANQVYTTQVDVIARSSVIYITALFTGVVGMITVQPVFFSERPAFYREKESEMYDVALYTMAAGIVEVGKFASASVSASVSGRRVSVCVHVCYGTHPSPSLSADTILARIVSAFHVALLFHRWVRQRLRG